MQVLLNTDTHIEGGHAMAEHLESVVKDALGRFGAQVTRVEAHLTDANSRQKTHPDEIHCTLEAKLVGLPAVVVKDQADNPHQAIRGAAAKLQRAIGAVVAKHESHRHATSLKDGEADAAPDGPA